MQFDYLPGGGHDSTIITAYQCERSVQGTRVRPL
jgi:hypothetical protein